MSQIDLKQPSSVGDAGSITTKAPLAMEAARKPYFTAEQLAAHCHETMFEDLEADASKLLSTQDMHGMTRRRILPPQRPIMVHRANETFDAEHKGWVYYFFWYVVVAMGQIPFHYFLWSSDNPRNSQKLFALGVNFFLTVFVRTVWFKWLIYMLTIPTYYLPVNGLKMAINKTVVNNGGIHSACASCLTFDLVYLVGQAIYDGAGGTTRDTYHFFVATTTMVLLLLIVFFAMPWRDNRVYHEMFEFSHRYGGWLISGLYFSDVLISLLRGGDDVFQINDLGVWFALMGIFLIAYPWLGILKSYNTDTYLYAPSNWVVIASLPKIYLAVGGTASQIAFGGDEAGEYHSFACLRDLNGDPNKVTMGVARAGDWTSKLVDKTLQSQSNGAEYNNSNPNSQLCFNRVAAPGFMWLVRNYKRVVCIGTGAGIAPISSFLPNPPCQMMVLWIGRNFEDTYGPLYNFVANYHNSILIDTKQEPSEANPYAPISTVETEKSQTSRVFGRKKRCRGAVERRQTQARLALDRPDLSALAKAAVELFNAEAVFIISGQKPTFKVCHELWKVGVHAYGATWDS